MAFVTAASRLRVRRGDPHGTTLLGESGHMPQAEELEAFEYAVRHFIDHIMLGRDRPGGWRAASLGEGIPRPRRAAIASGRAPRSCAQRRDRRARRSRQPPLRRRMRP